MACCIPISGAIVSASFTNFIQTAPAKEQKSFAEIKLPVPARPGLPIKVTNFSFRSPLGGWSHLGDKTSSHLKYWITSGPL